MSDIEKPAPLRSLVASAKRLTNKDISRKNSHRRMASSIALQEGWQDEAWDMYDLVGEERFLATTISGRLGKARLFVGKMGDDMADTPEKVEDKRITDVLRAFGKTTAGRSQLLERLSVNMFVTGEGWLVGIPTHVMNRNEPGWEAPEGYDEENVPLSEFSWRMLSTSEIKLSANDRLELLLDNDDPLEVSADEVFLIRVWRPHPRRWWEADSSTRAALPILREMVSLTMHISAQVESRLAGAGILIVPESARKAINTAAGRSPDDQTDEFTEALIDAMVTPIQNRGSASAIVPLVVTVPDSVANSFHHLNFSSKLDSAAREMRDDAIRRLSLSLDAPPEVLMGTSGLNHWSGWLVQEDVVNTHIEPPLALICDAITTQYLWPVLEGMGIEDFEHYVVWYNVEHLVVRPNRLADAVQMFNLGLISAEVLREVAGFDATDAPSSEDPAKEIILEMVRSNPGMLRSSSLPDMLDRLQRLIDNRPLTDPAEDAQGAEEAAPEGEDTPAAAAPEEATSTPEAPAYGPPTEVAPPNPEGAGMASTLETVLPAIIQLANALPEDQREPFYDGIEKGLWKERWQ